jgi:hypothetical protein
VHSPALGRKGSVSPRPISALLVQRRSTQGRPPAASPAYSKLFSTGGLEKRFNAWLEGPSVIELPTIRNTLRPVQRARFPVVSITSY